MRHGIFGVVDVRGRMFGFGLELGFRVRGQMSGLLLLFIPFFAVSTQEGRRLQGQHSFKAKHRIVSVAAMRPVRTEVGPDVH